MWTYEAFLIFHLGDSKLERQFSNQLLAVRHEKQFLIENRRRLEMEFKAQRAKQEEESAERWNEIQRLNRKVVTVHFQRHFCVTSRARNFHKVYR